MAGEIREGTESVRKIRPAAVEFQLKVLRTKRGRMVSNAILFCVESASVFAIYSGTNCNSQDPCLRDDAEKRSKSPL